MTTEKPVRIVPNKWARKHKTETRIFAREIHESFCIQPGCKFKGKHSQQGVCHTKASMAGEGAPLAYVERVMQWAEEALKETRRLNRGGRRKNYIRYLESMHVCDTANNAFMLDELIRLRAEVACLRLRVQRRGRR